MAKCVILVGPPCAGKSTFASKQKYKIISCDKIRRFLFREPYIFSDQNEQLVWEEFYNYLKYHIKYSRNIIIDNTNCRVKYINKIKDIIRESSKFNDYEIEYKYFDIPLWKLLFRNYIRYFKTKRWIPMKVIKNMKKNFDKIKYTY